ncbi:MAG: DUF1156 domain-containing protein [Acidobacteria bacterium]|nr:DUF1156 domain-containing protein [Acidobacteriota bacterium]
MSIETRFDVAFVAAMARREKQIQQNYRPIIAVHKWFARRPGTLFRGLTLAEFGDGPLSETFFSANDFAGRTIADPFMGGGTPLLEANRVGCDVLGVDINLWRRGWSAKRSSTLTLPRTDAPPTLSFKRSRSTSETRTSRTVRSTAIPTCP